MVRIKIQSLINFKATFQLIALPIDGLKNNYHLSLTQTRKFISINLFEDSEKFPQNIEGKYNQSKYLNP